MNNNNIDDDNDRYDHSSDNSLYQWFMKGIQKYAIIIIIIFIVFLKLFLFLLFSIGIYNYSTTYEDKSYHETYNQYNYRDAWIERPQNLR